MPSNLLHKEPGSNSGAKSAIKCSFCKRSNPVVAKFCGGCGKSTTQLKVKKQGLSSLRKFLVKKRKLAVIFLFLILFSLTGALFIGEPDAKQVDTVQWSDFRAFLARRFEVPHYELDSIYAQIFADSPVETSQIGLEQIISLENFFKESFKQPDLTVFPNPFFENANTPASANETPESRIFADVPDTHPVYAAIRSLIDMGLNCSDTNNHIRPYDKMTWLEWKKITANLMKILSLDKEFIEKLTAGQNGTMSNIDLRNFLEHLRERLFIKNTSPLIYSREKFYPSRLEILAALANVVNELNETR